MPKKKKPLVFDTNVFIQDPDACTRYPKAEIIIPIYVVEELDGLKKGFDETAHNARKAMRFLDEARGKKKIENGASVTIALTSAELPPLAVCRDLMDSRIIAVALENDGVLVSYDLNVRIRAEALGCEVAEHKIPKPAAGFRGFHEISAPDKEVDEIHAEGEIEVILKDPEIQQNDYLVVSSTSSSKTALCRVAQKKKNDALVEKIVERNSVWGLRPKNTEQRFLIDALLNPDIFLVTASSPAGSGKTLCAVAAGLHSVQDARTHKKLLVSRPIVSMGNELGFLPGGQSEKLDPWMSPIFDSIETLLGNDDKKRRNHNPEIKPHQFLLDMGVLELQSLEHIRGRSIHNQFFVIDEAQNLSIHEVRSIITRAGNNTKIVLLGDPSQIDTPKLTRETNGLSYAIERFRSSPLAAHITLSKCERSALAEEAASLLF